MRSVSVEDLKPGMILARSIINDDMVVVLSEGTLLTKAHITRLGFLDVPSVYVKDEYELSEAFQNVSAMFNPGTAFVTEYKSVINTARDIFDEASKSGKAPVEKSQTMVHDTLAPMSKQSGAIDYLVEVNHLANDVYNHSVRVSILSGVIAKWMRKSAAETQDIILAGFLHDIGKTKFPERLIDRQVETLKGEDNIHLYARIIALADLYDNITTEREGQRKRTPFEAIDRITADMYTKLDPKVCVPFLTHIKEAFLGSRVMLNNGMLGTIVRYNNDFVSKPLIRVNEDQIIDLNNNTDIKITEYNPK